jgi:hypothetical protein
MLNCSQVEIVTVLNFSTKIFAHCSYSAWPVYTVCQACGSFEEEEEQDDENEED